MRGSNEGSLIGLALVSPSSGQICLLSATEAIPPPPAAQLHHICSSDPITSGLTEVNLFAFVGKVRKMKGENPVNNYSKITNPPKLLVHLYRINRYFFALYIITSACEPVAK